MKQGENVHEGGVGDVVKLRRRETESDTEAKRELKKSESVGRKKENSQVTALLHREDL